MAKSTMLGEISARELHGPWSDFMEKLQGDNSREWFDGFKRFLRKENPWHSDSLTIDLDADPFIFSPKDLKVEEHQKGGILTWHPGLIANPHLDDSQKNGKTIKGHKLRENLKGHPVFNANMLDFLLANPHLIPEKWKGKVVDFWGTIYRGSNGLLLVRRLFFNGVRWHWDYGLLDDDWNGCNPAALSAS